MSAMNDTVEPRLDHTSISLPKHIGIVGAGVAGLRCADVLLRCGFSVTILEGRNRLGGRLHQERLPNGQTVDMGPNWIHGTGDNPILKLAQLTGTTISGWDTPPSVYGAQGRQMSLIEGERYSSLMWDIVLEAFRYSEKHSAQIGADESLLDFFRQRVVETVAETEDGHMEKREIILQMAELWGAFVGSPIERQSLKFFWLEECIEDGMNLSPCRRQGRTAQDNREDTGLTNAAATIESLFCASTYRKILEEIARPAIEGANINYETVVSGVYGRSSVGSKVQVETTAGRLHVFDGIVLTVPLGWLKQHLDAFKPSLPNRLIAAIGNIGYGCLEKVFISFATAFWLKPDVDGQTVQGFCQWLSPTYAPETNPARWTAEAVELASLSPTTAHPTLLFYVYGASSQHITSSVRGLAPDKRAAFLLSFFLPYYTRLPHYDADDPACRPTGALATDWLGDDLAGNGSYGNFQVGLREGSKDIEAMREGVPVEGIWLAGEHTAPFEALGTVTGAYSSGEAVARRIAKVYGRGKDRHEVEDGSSASAGDG